MRIFNSEFASEVEKRKAPTIENEKPTYIPLNRRFRRFPNWFRRSINEAITAGRLPPWPGEWPKRNWSYSSFLIEHTDSDRIWDHWGAERQNGKDLLISEPYQDITPELIEKLTAIGEILRVRIAVTDDSEWFQGETVKIIFIEPYNQENRSSQAPTTHTIELENKVK